MQNHRYLFILLVSLVLLACLLTACTQAGSSAVATETTAAAAPTTLPTPVPSDTPAPTEPPLPTAPPTETQAPTAESLALTDGLGRAVTLASPAQRIISLAPSNTELLFAVGAGRQLVGRDSFSDYPAEAKDVPDIGYGFTGLNLEVILSYQPDLVLAAALTPLEEIQSMEDAGLVVFAVPNPTEFAGLFANLLTVGKLTGHNEEAGEAAAALEARYNALIDKLAAVTERPLVFYELDSTEPNAPWTTGPGTFIDLLIQLAGGQNLGSDLSGEWVQISVEELLVRDPDIILLGDATWGGVTAAAVKARAGWEGLTAVKQDKIYPVDDNLISRPGPRLVDGLEAMARLLQPQLFK